MVNAFRLPGVAALATLVALVATALSACSPDEADPVATGTIVSLAGQRVDAAEHTLQLPDRQVEVRAEDLGQDLAGRSAGDGRRWVGIAWESRSGAGVPSWLATVVEQTDGAAETDTLDATLVVGDQRVPVGSPTSDAVTSDGANTRPTFAVAVPAEGALSLDVGFDGVSQTLDLETGAQTSLAATALTGLPDAQPAGTDCGGQWQLEGTAQARSARAVCQQFVVRLPYVAGLGWADDPAQPWVVLFATVDLPDEVRDGAVTYQVGDARDATVLGGQGPALRELDDAQAGAWSVISVYPSSAEAPLQLGGRVELARSSGDGPESVQVTVAGPDVAVPAPPT